MVQLKGRDDDGVEGDSLQDDRAVVRLDRSF